MSIITGQFSYQIEDLDIKNAKLEIYVPNTSNAFTLETWIKIDSLSEGKSGTIYSDTGKFGAVTVEMLSDGRVLCTATSKSETDSSTDSSTDSIKESISVTTIKSLPTDIWTHYACVLDGNSLLSFANGGQVDHSESNNPLLGPVDTSGGDAPTIGCQDPSCTNVRTNFHGQLDDLRLYKTSRTQNEIAKSLSPLAPNPSVEITSKVSERAGRERDGTAQSRPADDCSTLRTLHPHSKSGPYWILGGETRKKGEETKPTLAYCDMSTRGGGWTAVHKFVGGTETRAYASSFIDPSVSNRDIFSDGKRLHTSYVDPFTETPGIVNEQLWNTMAKRTDVEWMKSMLLYDDTGSLVSAQEVVMSLPNDVSLSTTLNVDVGCTPTATPLLLTVGSSTTTSVSLRFGSVVKRTSNNGRIGLPSIHTEDCGNMHGLRGGEDETVLKNSLACRRLFVGCKKALRSECMGPCM